MKNLTRAERKKARRSFKVGDVVTWGDGCISHVVVEVKTEGLVVDTSSGTFGAIQPDGRRHMLVLFDRNMRISEGYHTATSKGPPRHSENEPDKEIQSWKRSI